MDTNQENRKSNVRVFVTYGATAFLFGGGALFILYLLVTKQVDHAVNLFQTILPVSAAIISYWFGNRGAGKAADHRNKQPTQDS